MRLPINRFFARLFALISYEHSNFDISREEVYVGTTLVSQADVADVRGFKKHIHLGTNYPVSTTVTINRSPESYKLK